MADAVACIIFDKEKRVLLIKRRDIPVWVLPGGGMDAGESPEEAAIREAQEETGCQCEILRKVARYLPANKLTRKTHFYECTLTSGTPKKGPETRDIAFFPPSQLPKHLVPFYKTWINDALAASPTTMEKTIEKTSYWTFLHYLVCHPLLVFRFLLTRMGIHLNTPEKIEKSP